MEALFMRTNLFSIVEGTKSILKILHYKLHGKIKNTQAKCELILNIGDQQV
jgi:hypothetical protein